MRFQNQIRVLKLDLNSNIMPVNGGEIWREREAESRQMMSEEEISIEKERNDS